MARPNPDHWIRVFVCVSLLVPLSFLLLFLNDIHTAVMVPHTMEATSTAATTSSNQIASSNAAISGSLEEAREKVLELENQSKAAERRSNFWTTVSVGAGLIAAVTGWVALKQAKRENQIDERLRKADQTVAAIVMEQQQTATESARGEAAKALNGLGQASLEIENRRKENLELERKLEAERMERLALEAAVAPRSVLLTEPVRADLLKALESLPKKSVYLYAPNVTPESERLAEDLFRLLQMAGCSAGGKKGDLVMGMPTHGIFVRHPEGVDATATALRDALVAAGLPNVTLEVEGIEADGRLATLLILAK